jgi:hypothetical protein
MAMAVPNLNVLFHLNFYRDQMHVSVPDARLRDDSIGTGAYIGGSSLQYHRFETIVMVEVDVLRGDREVVMIMLNLRYPIGKLALMMIVDITDRRDAPFRLTRGNFGLAQRFTNQITESLRTIKVALALDQFIESIGQIIIDRDC